jgi:predicted regulator of Ras-like GTPase activity (Roadblock/LC7/MglB family)
VDAALTPELALAYLGELSTDIRAAVVLGPDGEPVAGSHDLAAAARELLRLCGGAGVEVLTPRGSVFAVRVGDYALAVVTGRFALPALVRYDVRRVLGDLQPGVAA